MIEAQAIFGNLIQKDIGYTEIQVDTLEEVTAFGLKEVTARLNAPAMIEDAGLFIDGLKGFPGVYSAYVSDPWKRGHTEAHEWHRGQEGCFRIGCGVRRARNGACDVSRRDGGKDRV